MAGTTVFYICYITKPWGCPSGSRILFGYQKYVLGIRYGEELQKLQVGLPLTIYMRWLRV